MTAPQPHHYIQVGFGTDCHRLVPGEGLHLGGIFIPASVAAVAVSDGDVLLHAVTDAVLGSAGLGDIGDHFPASRVEPGAPSAPMLAHALGLLHACGGTVANADCVVDLEVIKLGSWKNRIRDSLASLLGIAPTRVNVKAKTAEGMGPVGTGEAIAAQAVVLVSFHGGDEA